MKKSLTIAGSDCIGGAGIQADIKAMSANGVYAMSVITALTAQNTTGVRDIMEVSPEFLENQIDAIFTDIYPDSVKIGMVSSPCLIQVICRKLKEYSADNIVVDPVMVATSGARLLQDDALEMLKEKLMPMAKLVTPNIPEAEILGDMKIRSDKDMERVGEKISSAYGCGVLIKGGHSLNDANDYFYSGEKGIWFYGKRIDNENTHGTGCTLSSAIATGLAKGLSVEKSIENAKKYLSEALDYKLDLGKGKGPMNHFYFIK